MKVYQKSNKKTNINKTKKEKQTTQQIIRNNINNINNPKNTNGLGNSLFRGQKFIDFQEPFNESIKPIRNYVKDRGIQPGNLNDKNPDGSEYVQVEIEDDLINSITEKEKLLQNNFDSNANTYIDYNSSELNKVKPKNSFSYRSSFSNSKENEYYSNCKPNTDANDKLISNSKYFNNLIERQRQSLNLQKFNNFPEVIPYDPYEGKDNICENLASYRPHLIEDDYMNIINANIRSKNDSINSNIDNKNILDINYKNTNDSNPYPGFQKIQHQSNQCSTKANSKNTSKT